MHSTILTTNILFSKWGDAFQDSAVTVAILDRLIYQSRVFQITGNSYRMKDYKLEREQHSKKKNTRTILVDRPVKNDIVPLFFG